MATYVIISIAVPSKKIMHMGGNEKEWGEKVFPFTGIGKYWQLNMSTYNVVVNNWQDKANHQSIQRVGLIIADSQVLLINGIADSAMHAITRYS